MAAGAAPGLVWLGYFSLLVLFSITVGSRNRTAFNSFGQPPKPHARMLCRLRRLRDSVMCSGRPAGSELRILVDEAYNVATT